MTPQPQKKPGKPKRAERTRRRRRRNLKAKPSSTPGWAKLTTATNAIPDSYDAFRADTRFELTYPGKYLGWLSVVPRVAYRGTYWDKTRDRIETSTLEETTSTNELGEAVTTVTPKKSVRYEEGDAGFRSVFEAGAEVSTRAYGYWDAADGLEWRHVLEPYANYTFIPEPNLLRDELYQFDAVDRIAKTHSLRLGLRQRWQNRDPVEESIREPFYLDAWTDVDLDTEGEEESFADFGWDARYRPATWMEVRWKGLYDNNDGDLATTEVQLTAWHDVFKCDAIYRWRNDVNSYFDGGVTWNANEFWSFNVFGRYEFETSQVEEAGGWIQRSWDCIAIRLIGSVEPGYTNEAGLREEDDWHLTVTGWLTDFVPRSILEENAR